MAQDEFAPNPMNMQNAVTKMGQNQMQRQANQGVVKAGQKPMPTAPRVAPVANGRTGQPPAPAKMAAQMAQQKAARVPTGVGMQTMTQPYGPMGTASTGVPSAADKANFFNPKRIGQGR